MSTIKLAIIKFFSILFIFLFVTSCTNKIYSEYISLYDYQIIESASKKTITTTNLVKNLQTTDVVFIGEFHSHQASHKLQLDLIQMLYQQNPHLVISMEQFSRDVQPILDGYLAGKYGEETLIEDANAWDNYKGSYRPIMEFAKEHHIPIIAANAPAMFVRCMGRRGSDFLTSIPEEKRSWSARKIDLSNKKYQEKFFSFLKSSGTSHGQSKKEASNRQIKTYSAQLLRDTTMAESILSALDKYPNHQVIHLNGSFHSDNHLGTVAVIETERPSITTQVISPVMSNSLESKSIDLNEYQQGEYLYLIKELPPRFLDEDKEMKSISKLIRSRMKEKCEL
ncbi:MAG: hypothetical protein COB38_11400 [Gammaproteobacteria bacterium]|nr:MAG: hypothetical protein COB38_11400 [Gammaproteobacteria bacterium]